MLLTSNGVFEALFEHFFPRIISFYNMVVVHGGIGLLLVWAIRRLSLINMLEIDILSNTAHHRNLLVKKNYHQETRGSRRSYPHVCALELRPYSVR